MKIRLAFPLRFQHFEIPAGTVIDIPADLARMAISRSIAEPAEYETAVIAPQETRGRGRPRKYPIEE